MDIRAISFKKFLKNKNDVYKNVNVVAKRARQIIDKRYMKIEALKNIEDTEQLIEIEDDDLAKPKSISIAMNELMEKDLECSEVEEKEEDVE